MRTRGNFSSSFVNFSGLSHVMVTTFKFGPSLLCSLYYGPFFDPCSHLPLGNSNLFAHDHFIKTTRFSWSVGGRVDVFHSIQTNTSNDLFQPPKCQFSQGTDFGWFTLPGPVIWSQFGGQNIAMKDHSSHARTHFSPQVYFIPWGSFGPNLGKLN